MENNNSEVCIFLLLLFHAFLYEEVYPFLKTSNRWIINLFWLFRHFIMLVLNIVYLLKAAFWTCRILNLLILWTTKFIPGKDPDCDYWNKVVNLVSIYYAFKILFLNQSMMKKLINSFGCMLVVEQIHCLPSLKFFMCITLRKNALEYKHIK